MELIFPNMDFKQEALNYRQDCFDVGETEIHGDGGLDTADTYEGWLEKVNSDLTRSDGGFVPSTQYFAVVDGKVAGMIQIRHSLNDKLLQSGGHIGYSIRPSERRKGYAARMLALALDKCREMGIGKVLITCDKNNAASSKTITRNGGVLENEITEESGRVTQRYWIIL